MAKKLIVIIICLSIFASTIPRLAFGFNVPSDIGTGTQIPATGSLSCVGIWTKIICVIKKIADIIKTVQKITKALDYVPHQFPFGGPILSSERACELKFRSTTWIGVYILGYWAPIPGTFTISKSLVGRAIEVGPPVPSGGKVIAFPWISKIYQQHTEKRAGPWALGLGFSPFPLKDINDALKSIRIWIPPNPLDTSCFGFAAAGYVSGAYYGRVGFLAQCFDNFQFDCQASGEKDPQGNDIYKVIRLLGTSKDDVPQETLQRLKTSFPSFPWF